MNKKKASSNTTKKVVKKNTTKKVTPKTETKKKKKKGAFTLIELLAVIIILGVIMIIAIPSVTKYISNSRKNAYIDTAKNLVGSARTLVNSGDLEMYDQNATYYIPVTCLKTENRRCCLGYVDCAMEWVDDCRIIMVEVLSSIG